MGTALSTLGANGNLMDVHLIVSPNPLVPRGAATAVEARGSDALFSQAVGSLTGLLQTQSRSWMSRSKSIHSRGHGPHSDRLSRDEEG